MVVLNPSHPAANSQTSDQPLKLLLSHKLQKLRRQFIRYKLPENTFALFPTCLLLTNIHRTVLTRGALKAIVGQLGLLLWEG